MSRPQHSVTDPMHRLSASTSKTPRMPLPALTLAAISTIAD